MPSKRPSRVFCILMHGLVAGLLATNAFSKPDLEKSKQVPVDQLPKALVAVVQKRFPDGKITQAAKALHLSMDEGGNMSVIVTDDKKEFNVVISCMNANYQINAISHDLAPTELPRFVVKTVRAKYPQAKITATEEIQNGLMGWKENYPKPPDYLVWLKTTNDEELELFLTPDLKRTAAGNSKPDPGRVHIESEMPGEKAANKQHSTTP